MILSKFEKEIGTEGFFRTFVPDEELKSFAREIENRISEISLDPSVIGAGYSQDISMLISPGFTKYLTSIAEPLLRNKWVKKNLPFPRIVNIMCSYSFFNEDAVKNATHAHLWHRDLDDFGPQLKIFVPLTPCNETNGQFSCLSNRIAGWKDLLLDSELIQKLESSPEDEYRKSDGSNRITDKTLRKSVPANTILDFTSKIGDLLLIDTNSTYHKGGLILENGAFRIMVQVTIGSATHAWYNPTSIAPKVFQSVLRLYRSKFGKFTKIFNNRVPRYLG